MPLSSFLARAYLTAALAIFLSGVPAFASGILSNNDLAFKELFQNWKANEEKFGDKDSRTLKSLFILASSEKTARRYKKAAVHFQLLFNLLSNKGENVQKTLIKVSQQLIETYLALGQKENAYKTSESLIDIQESIGLKDYSYYYTLYSASAYLLDNYMPKQAKQYHDIIIADHENQVSENIEQLYRSVKAAQIEIMVLEKQFDTAIESANLQLTLHANDTSKFSYSIKQYLKSIIALAHIYKGNEHEGFELLDALLFEKIESSSGALSQVAPNIDEYIDLNVHYFRQNALDSIFSKLNALALSYNNHSLTYLELRLRYNEYLLNKGMYDTSLAIGRELYSSASRAYGFNSDITIKSQHQLAKSYYALGLIDESVDLLKKALKEAALQKQKFSTLYVNLHLLLANIYNESNRVLDAQTHIKIAHAHAESILFNPPIKEKVLASYLAIMALEIENKQPYINQAKQSAELTNDLNILLSFLSFGKAVNSDSLINNIIEKLEYIYHNNSISTKQKAHLAQALAEHFYDMNYFKKAKEYYIALEYLVEKSLHQTTALFDEHKVGLYSQYQPSFDKLFNIYRKNNNVESAFLHIEKHKSLLLKDKLINKITLEQAKLSDSEKQEINALFSQKEAITNEHLSILQSSKLEEKVRDRKLSAITKKYLETDTELNELKKLITKVDSSVLNEHESTAYIVSKSDINLAALESVYISFHFDENRLFSFVKKPNQPVITQSVDNSVAIINTIKSYSMFLASGLSLKDYTRENNAQLWKTKSNGFVFSNNKPENTHRIKDRVLNIKQLQKYLAQKLLFPIWEHLKNEKNVIFSSDNALSLLPIETLPSPDGAIFLLSHNVSYTPSLSIWNLTIEREKSQSRGTSNDIYAVGNPNYSIKNQSCSVNLANEQRTDTLNRIASTRGLNRDELVWCDLPGSARELSFLKKHFSNTNSTFLDRNNASEFQVKKDNKSNFLSRYNYIHFATHGYSDENTPQNSSIILNQDDQFNDGYLTASEIASLKLQSELVVLSACSTASNPIKPGMGISGLPYSFYVAGNQSTLMTLWAVDDEATAILMDIFYRKVLKGIKPRLAINEAKRELINTERYSNSYFWAPFIFYGV
ncbi:CHAT domain-containing protein [Thalassotalea litorea]|uniref:CHAT domain-containing protein n=1 Tax=Thalassotalea litorea TaxID=2020715 RepID=UPI0037359F0F